MSNPSKVKTFNGIRKKLKKRQSKPRGKVYAARRPGKPGDRDEIVVAAKLDPADVWLEPIGVQAAKERLAWVLRYELLTEKRTALFDTADGLVAQFFDTFGDETPKCYTTPNEWILTSHTYDETDYQMTTYWRFSCGIAAMNSTSAAIVWVIEEEYPDSSSITYETHEELIQRRSGEAAPPDLDSKRHSET